MAVSIVSIPIDVTFFVPLKADVNGDCIVDIFDLAAVGKAFGSQPGDANWNPDADMNGDNIINIIDLATVGKEFGSTC